MRIVHVVHRDKFTVGYINFMNTYINEHSHFFVMEELGYPLNITTKNIHYIDNFSKVRKRKEIWELLKSSDLIIVSGIFSSIHLLTHLPRYITKKTLLQFWGGDFYLPKKKGLDPHYFFIKYRKKYCFNKCAGFIFLIEGENKEFKKRFNLKKRYFIAPVPAELNRNVLINSIRKEHVDKNRINILVGNSATASNQHREIIEWLSSYKNCDIKVYVPLSYGEENYKEQIINYGKEKLGDIFTPMTEFMDKKQYIRFLNMIDIGIFNNNRQQAMGNILILLALGKKVYLRVDTSMWDRFVSEGYSVYPLKSINQISYSKLVEFPEKIGKKNEEIFDKNENVEKIIVKWEKIFDEFEKQFLKGI